MFRLYVNLSYGTVIKIYKEEHIDSVYEVKFLSAMPLIIIINISLFCTSWYLYLIMALWSRNMQQLLPRGSCDWRSVYVTYLHYLNTTECLILASFVFSDSVQTCSEAQPASSSMVTGTCFREVKRPRREADDSFLLVPWFELNGATRALLHVTSWLVQRQMYHYPFKILSRRSAYPKQVEMCPELIYS